MENNNRQDRPLTCGAAALTEGDKIRLMHAIETTNDRTDEEARHFRRDLNRLLLMGGCRPSDSQTVGQHDCDLRTHRARGDIPHVPSGMRKAAVSQQRPRDNSSAFPSALLPAQI